MTNELTKDELQIILLEMNIVITRTNKEGILKISPIFFELRDKIQSMIDNYCEHEYLQGVHLFKDIYCVKCKKSFPVKNIEDSLQTIGTGQLLFQDKESASAILPKIHKQFDLCENSDESKCFRIDWKILYGSKTGE